MSAEAMFVIALFVMFVVGWVSAIKVRDWDEERQRRESLNGAVEKALYGRRESEPEVDRWKVLAAHLVFVRAFMHRFGRAVTEAEEKVGKIQ